MAYRERCRCHGDYGDNPDEDGPAPEQGYEDVA